MTSVIHTKEPFAAVRPFQILLDVTHWRQIKCTNTRCLYLWRFLMTSTIKCIKTVSPTTNEKKVLIIIYRNKNLSNTIIIMNFKISLSIFNIF